MNEQFFNKHYIRIDDQSRIITGFSDAFQQPEPSDILINSEGGYQFRLFPGGEENPALFDDLGVPLYSWDKRRKVVITRKPEEIDVERHAVIAAVSKSVVSTMKAAGFYAAIPSNAPVEGTGQIQAAIARIEQHLGIELTTWDNEFGGTHGQRNQAGHS